MKADSGFFQATEETPTTYISVIKMQCKQLLLHRCLDFIKASLILQIVFFYIFLVFLNFDILHPINWIINTIIYIFKFATWIYSIILGIGICFYALIISSYYLSLPVYYPSRFQKLVSTGLREFISIFAHGFLGILSVWFYTRFLNEDYKDLTFTCFEGYCLNNNFVFLAVNGINAGLYYYIRERLFVDPEIRFPVIQETKLAKLRSAVYDGLYKSFTRSFLSTIGFFIIYFFFGWIITTKIANFLNIQHVESIYTGSSYRNNIYIMCLAWMLSVQIQANIFILNSFLIALLTMPIQFPVESGPIIVSSVPTIVEALSMSKLPLIKQLASIDFAYLAITLDATRRNEIFSLCAPGGHPVNWNRISNQVLNLMEEFIEELTTAIKKISTLKSNVYYKRIEPIPNETAEKILLRQYNATYGIRRIDEHNQQQTTTNSNNNVINKMFGEFIKNIDEACKTLFRSIPGLFFMFGEADGAKTVYLLSNSQHIIWLVQGLASLCCASITEDKYGVMQNDLQVILATLLKLKLELDQLNNVILNGKKINHNCNALKGAVKRSLYKICTVFRGCLRDFVEDEELILKLQSFITYKEE